MNSMTTISEVKSPGAFCGVSEINLTRAAKATCQGSPSCATPALCGPSYDKGMTRKSVDSLKVDLNSIAPCPTLLERHHGIGSRTSAEIEEERQRRRKELEALREKRLEEEIAYRAEERRRQEQAEAYEERARRALDHVREEWGRQHRAEAACCPCFVV